MPLTKPELVVLAWGCVAVAIADLGCVRRTNASAAGALRAGPARRHAPVRDRAELAGAARCSAFDILDDTTAELVDGLWGAGQSRRGVCLGLAARQTRVGYADPGVAIQGELACVAPQAWPDRDAVPVGVEVLERADLGAALGRAAVAIEQARKRRPARLGRGIAGRILRAVTCRPAIVAARVGVVADAQGRLAGVVRGTRLNGAARQLRSRAQGGGPGLIIGVLALPGGVVDAGLVSTIRIPPIAFANRAAAGLARHGGLRL